MRAPASRDTCAGLVRALVKHAMFLQSQLPCLYDELYHQAVEAVGADDGSAGPARVHRRRGGRCRRGRWRRGR